MSFQHAFLQVPRGVPREKLLSLIRLDQGTVEEHDEDDGSVTLIATFPGDPPRLQRTVDGGVAPWLDMAERERGVREAGPGGSNPRIEAYHASTSGGAAPDTVPWCSSFVNFCIEQAGLEGTDSKRARSWETWGSRSELRPGAVVVFKRGEPPKGHVGFFVGRDSSGKLLILGGNQSNAVSVVGFEDAAVEAVRWPAAVAGPAPADADAALSGVRAAGLAPPERIANPSAAALASEYRAYFAKCRVTSDRVDRLDQACQRIVAGKARYQALTAKCGVPWFLIGALHEREASCKFTGHLHNGDPLSARTSNHPPGRPATEPQSGAAYSWEESAADALCGPPHELDQVTEWSLPRLLFEAERYNGFGNRSRGVPSAYLWGFSDLYVKGGFPRDHQFDPEFVSKQAGVATMLARLRELGEIDLPD